MIGPHIGNPSIGHMLGTLAAWRPRPLLINNPGQGAGGVLRARMSSDALVGRVVLPDHEIEGRIRASLPAAVDHALSLTVQHANGNPEIRTWQWTNEVLTSSPGDINLLGEFSLRLAERLSGYGLRLAAGGFSTGTPRLTNEGSHWSVWCEWWEKLLRLDAWLLIHEYWADSRGPDESPWLFGRFEHKVKPHLDSMFHDAPYFIGETGCDMLRDRLGWRTAYQGNSAAYLSHLELAGERIATWRGCQGATVFTWSHSGGWDDFEIDGAVAEGAARVEWPAPAVPAPVPVPVPVPPTPTPTPPGGSMSDRLATALRNRFGERFSDLRGTLPAHKELRYQRRSTDEIKGYAFHHTGNETTRATTWERIAAYHVDGNNWPGIAYALGVRYYGGHAHVALLQDLETVTYHVGDENRRQLGIVTMGDFTRYGPYREEVDTLREIVTELDALLGRTPAINPHRAFRTTECPASIADYLGVLRQEEEQVDPSALIAAARKAQNVSPNLEAALQKAAFRRGYWTILSPEVRQVLDGKQYVGQLFSNQHGKEAVFYARVDDWANVEEVAL